MAYTTGQDLVNSVLFDSGESQSSGASAFRARALDYINRAYKTLCAGASEFLPERVEDWWWLRDKATLTLFPVYDTGTITVTQNSASVNLSDAPTFSVMGRMLRVEGHPEIFQVSAHTAAANLATLDSVYTGPSGSFAFKLMRVYYDLDVAVNALIAPMIGYRGNAEINGVSPEGMDRHFPLPELEPGVPTMFALEDSQTVRFNKGGRIDGQRMRIDYRYRPVISDITDSSGSIPLVPAEYRHLLSDMAAAFVLRAKNDNRDQSFALSARNGLAAMFSENKRRLKRMDRNTGHIFPRGGGKYGDPPRNGIGPLRTESGLIIG